MMGKRLFLAIAASALVLSGCVGTPLLEEDARAALVVRNVSVDVTGYENVQGRNLSISSDQLQADMTSAIETELSPVAGGNTVVDVTVTRVYLVSPGQALLVGGASTITGTVTVTDAATGEVLLPTTTVRGIADGSWALGGAIAAATTGTPLEDYQNSVRSFASDLRIRLLGRQNTAS